MTAGPSDGFASGVNTDMLQRVEAHVQMDYYVPIDSLMRRRESHSSDSQIPIDCVSCELEKIKNKNGVKKILLWFLQCLFSANNTWEAARNNSWGA